MRMFGSRWRPKGIDLRVKIATKNVLEIVLKYTHNCVSGVVRTASISTAIEPVIKEY